MYDRVFESILDCVGKTPLVRLDKFSKTVGLEPGRLMAKVEFLNPGGSIKDRAAIHMVHKAEKEGTIKPGGTLIEATSGNMGGAIAMVAAAKGYQAILVMPEKTSTEKIRIQEAFGARVVITPTEAPYGDPQHYMSVAQRLAQETPNSLFLSQFTNPNNPEAHYETTGPEIWQDTHGRVEVLVGGVGTGGTLSGAGRFLKEQNPKIQIVIGDPEGSIIAGKKPGHPSQWLVEGIGEDYFPQTYDANVGDRFYHISDEQALQTARILARTEGILAGGSSGTILAAAISFAKEHPRTGCLVAMIPDSGRSYLSKMYNKEWLKAQGITVDGDG